MGILQFMCPPNSAALPSEPGMSTGLPWDTQIALYFFQPTLLPFAAAIIAPNRAVQMHTPLDLVSHASFL